MHSPSVDSPPAPSPYRTAVRTAIVLGLCSLVLLILVAAEWHPLLSVDGDVSRTTHRWAVADPDVTHAFRILTDWVWDPLTMRLLCAAVALWLVWRRAAWWTAAWLVTVSAVGTALQQGLKAALGRERPVWTDPVDSAHYAAYPSGHALTATVVLGLLLWLLHRHGARPVLWRTAMSVALVSVVGVGLTRVWLGVHWPTDVVGGWLMGAMLVSLAIAAHVRWRP
ncbi:MULTISPECIES: phosphatase PAP2 family protein [Streptomyces]|uniref:Phosphatase PAP2 family protein n=1 Tax=Streptomyces galilaeus TaxID=33899 RepID=A0ABW9IT87_STRGJ|nr:phosphatase PAP2 family protein [Streptomyces galilaeus]QEU64408.1 phosphatase PAP2 family protein [Streptomyces galilaeus]GGW59731.1 phosphatase PAP2 family protein [Streptomyces galilaeus]